MFVRLRLPVLLLVGAGIFAGGWWLGKNSAAGPAQHAAHSAAAQLPPPSAYPPGYLTSKAPPAPHAAGAEALTKLLEQRAKPEDLATALAAWAEQEPDAAFRALLADPRLQLPETARALFQVLGKNHPAQALQRLAQLPAVPWARQANQGLATGWTQRDPMAATTSGFALPPSTRRNDFLSAAFSQWLKQDIVAAHDWVLALPPEEPRDDLLTGEALGGAGIHSPQDMTAFLDLPLLYRNQFTEREADPFGRWSEKSPEAALQWALALPQERDDKTHFLSAALRPFASDPARILALLPQLNDPGVRENLVESVAYAWAQRDPAAAWDWSTQLTDPSLRQQFEHTLSSRWASLDPDTAIPWLSKNHSNQLSSISSDVLQKWSGVNPDATLAMLNQLPTVDFGGSIAEDLMKGIAMSQPALALTHLDMFQENKQRSAVICKAMDAWSQKDIAAASAYTDALPPGEDRQAAIGGILGSTFEESPESAITWAATLTDPSRKEQTIGTLFTKWQQKDPAAAQNWLDHAPLDDALRQKLTPSQP